MADTKTDEVDPNVLPGEQEAREYVEPEKDISKRFKEDGLAGNAFRNEKFRYRFDARGLLYISKGDFIGPEALVVATENDSDDIDVLIRGLQQAQKLAKQNKDA
jgi:hypothetical protein